MNSLDPSEGGGLQPQFDISPDGQRLVMIRSEVQDQLGVVVVTGFLADLKRRMAE